MAKLYNKTLYQMKQIISCVNDIDIEDIDNNSAKNLRIRFKKMNI